MQASVQFARKSLWSAIASAFVTLGSFLSSIIAARILGVSGSGEVAYVIWLMSVGSVVIDLGLSAIVARYVPEMHGRGQHREADQLAGTLVVILVVAVVGACALAFLCLHLGILPTEALRAGFGEFSLATLLAIYVSVQVLGAFTLFYLRGLQDFGRLARVCGLSLALQLICVAIGSYWFGVAGAVAGYIAGQVIPALLALTLVRHAAPIDASFRSRIWRYGAYSWAANIANAFVWARIEIFFLQRFWDSHSVGLFAAALTLTNLATQGPMLLTTAFLPLLSERYGAKDTAAMRNILSAGTRLLAALVFPACFGVAAVMPVLLPLLYGPDFAPAIVPAMVLVCVSGIAVTTVIATNLVNALERSDFIFANSFAGALVAVALGFALVPRFGLMGATAARASIQAGMIVVGCWFVMRRLHYPLPWRSLSRLLVASLCSGGIAGLCIAVVPSLTGLLLAAPVACIAYLLALRTLQALPSQDLAVLMTICESLPGPLKALSRRIITFVQRAPAWQDPGLMSDEPVGAKAR
jgi:O-antigen/teichoic acid export membrane protein